MNFIIKVTYKDGDSFSSYESNEVLDYSWTDEKIVIENMIAISNHYRAYRAENDSWYRDPEIGDYKTSWWYAKPIYSRTDNIDPGINLKRNDGTIFYYHCPWCGYFASLKAVAMEIKPFKIEIN